MQKVFQQCLNIWWKDLVEIELEHFWQFYRFYFIYLLKSQETLIFELLHKPIVQGIRNILIYFIGYQIEIL